MNKSKEAKTAVYNFIDTLGIARWSTVVRLLEHYLGEKRKGAWSAYISRLVKDTDLIYLRRANGIEESIIGSSSAKLKPLIEVQAAHEIRVSEVAAEFIRHGFTWTPPTATGKDSAKVSDGTAWLNNIRIEVEVELSPKKQARWNGIIARYRAQQEREAVGVVYIFGNDGIRNSFRTAMSHQETPGWWHLSVTNSQDVATRQEQDEHAVKAAKEAILNNKIFPTTSHQPDLFTTTPPPPPAQTDNPTSPPPQMETESQRLIRMRQERLAQKGQH